MMMKTSQSMVEALMGEVDDDEMAMEVVDSTTIRTVLNANSSIENSIELLPLWIEDNLNKLDDAYYNIDSEEDRISGIGSNIITIEVANYRTPTEFHFNYTFDIKENRVRFTIIEPYYYVVTIDEYGNEVTEPTKTYIDEDTLRRMSRGIKEKGLVESIIDHLEGVVSSDDDW